MSKARMLVLEDGLLTRTEIGSVLPVLEVGTKVTVTCSGELKGISGRVVALLDRPHGVKYRVLVFGKGSAFVFFPWEIMG